MPYKLMMNEECGHCVCTLSSGTSLTPDGRRRRGGGVCYLRLLPFASRRYLWNTGTVLRVCMLSRARKQQSSWECLASQAAGSYCPWIMSFTGDSVRYVCHVKWWCMLLVNWKSVYNLVCLECRKCTSKYKCGHRIVLTVVWGSTEWV